MHRMSNIIDQFCVFGRNRVALVNDMPSTRLLVTRLVQRKAAEEFPLGDFGFEPLAKYRESLSSRNLLTRTFPNRPDLDMAWQHNHSADNASYPHGAHESFSLKKSRAEFESASARRRSWSRELSAETEPDPTLASGEG